MKKKYFQKDAFGSNIQDEMEKEGPDSPRRKLLKPYKLGRTIFQESLQWNQRPNSVHKALYDLAA